MAKSRKSSQESVFNVCVIGAGYVGLVVAACLAKLGNNIISVDNDSEKIDSLNKLIIPNYEPGLADLIKEGVRRKKLTFTTNIKRGVLSSEIIFIAVGTPSKDGGEADLSAVEKVAFSIARNIDSYKLIVEKSTVPVRTGEKVKETVRRYAKKKIDFDVASNPEFLREGKAIDDFLHPDRIVLGVESKKAENILKRLYYPLGGKVLVTNINTAELIKHASNSFLATKISFINAVSTVCEKAGADIKKVAEGMGMDRRIGGEFLDAGVGWGGSCFPKDVDAFIHIARKSGYKFRLLEEVRNINIFQREHFAERIKEELWNLKGKNIAVWGLSFKPDTDDLREAPSLHIIDFLLREKAKVRVYDPKAMNKAAAVLGKRVVFAKSPYSAAKEADCVILLTDWDEFANIDFLRLKKQMRYPFIADGRNVYSRLRLSQAGFKYIGIGK